MNENERNEVKTSAGRADYGPVCGINDLDEVKLW